MSDKQYLLTEEDFNGCDICKFCIGNGEDCHGDYLCTAIDKVLEHHEYHERTCSPVFINQNEDDPVGDMSCPCGMPLEDNWAYCPKCGARVVDQ